MKRSSISLVVSTVIALIFTSAAQAQLSDEQRNRARAAATTSELLTIGTAVEAYLTDYPTPPAAKTMDDLRKLLEPVYVKGLPLHDEWGTPFRYECQAAPDKSYRIVSAGSDRTFDPATWTHKGLIADTAADAVFTNGAFFRKWDFDNGASARTEAAAVSQVVARETARMATLPEDQKRPYMMKLFTLDEMQRVGLALERYAADHHGNYPRTSSIDALKAALFPDYIDEMRTDDFWHTPFRYSATDDKSYTLVSAGSDKLFQPETWTKAGKFTSDAEDAVMRNGRLIREWQMSASESPKKQ
jgi:hypothetical protein